MQKTFLAIVFFGLIVSGCHTTKRTQRVVTDSVVSSSPVNTVRPVDSAEILKQVLLNKINTPLNFNTFYGKAKADLNSAQMSGSATVYIKIKKDSVIWISVTGPLNIEGLRALVTQDSVKVMNRLDHTVHISSIAHLQQLTKLPFTFNDFQNVILGRPVVGETNPDYTISKDSVIIKAASNALQFVHYFTKNNLLLGQSNYQAQTGSLTTNANIYYNGYQQVNAIDFATSRDIAVTGSSPAKLSLNFREYNFNQPQDFVFTISKNYTIKYD